MSTSKAKILVVEDDAAMQEVLLARLEAAGYDVTVALSADEARRAVARTDPDLVLCDLILPDETGLEILPELLGEHRRPVVVMTGYGSIDRAVAAMKLGAHDFLTKPLDYERLHEILDQAVRWRRSGASRAAAGLGPLLGSSHAMKRVFKLIERVAATDSSVLIVGESGTGKELAARCIHQLSGRAEGPLIALNAAAIPDTLTESELFGHEKGAFTGAAARRRGAFEEAESGTLFLDEISEMPIGLQPKLLRVLEERAVRRVGASRPIVIDARVIAATNREPSQAIEEGRLRQDLYYRLGVFEIHLPPLRERVGDLELLVGAFLEELSEQHGTGIDRIDDDAWDLLREYRWPGNVRELRNVLERAVVLAESGVVGPQNLPRALRRVESGSRPIVLPPGVSALEAERIVLLRTLEETGNNKAETARRLGLDVKTVRNRLKAYERQARRS